MSEAAEMLARLHASAVTPSAVSGHAAMWVVFCNVRGAPGRPGPVVTLASVRDEKGHCMLEAAEMLVRLDKGVRMPEAAEMLGKLHSSVVARMLSHVHSCI